MDTRRDQIINIIDREFIGPDPINVPGMIQKNGEEICGYPVMKKKAAWECR